MRKRSLFAALIVGIFSFLFLNFSSDAFASSKSFVTIVNPIRISPNSFNMEKSINAQYEEIKKRNVPATWLLTYDAVLNKKVNNVVENFDNKQELGIFFEVTSSSAKKAGINYNQTDSWHRANSIFLTGYSQKERVKFIDSVFMEFKKTYGYFPVSIGAWWIDSFSLDYMSRKYGILANLNVSDQAGTDGYHIFGTYWSIPYYPSKINSAFPARDLQNKVNVVTLRWAPRDPLNGFKSPDSREATRFSTQDYRTIGLNENFFKDLLSVYLDQDFGQVVIGLEGGYSPEVYSGEFGDNLRMADELVSEKGGKFTTMKDFANIYMDKYRSISPGILISSNDLLGSNKKIFWYQNSKYRIGLLYDFDDFTLKVIDLRSYFSNFKEAFYTSPNNQYDLYSIVPSIVDHRVNRESISFKTGSLKSHSNNEIEFQNGKIIFEDNQIRFTGIKVDFRNKYLNSDLIKAEDNKIIPLGEFPFGEDGLVFTELTPKVPFAIFSRFPKYIIYLALLFLLFVFLISTRRKPRHLKIFIAIIAVFLIGFLIYRKSHKLFVSQSEIDTLYILKKLENGKVLVLDKNCLRCDWESKYKPAAMEGRKDYVGRLSHKDIVYSLSFVLAKNPDEAKKIIKQLKIKYIYLSKYEKYIESLSFSPESLGLSKIYENANSTIFKVD